MSRKQIEATVSSLRLDTIVGAGFGCSRSKAARLIKEGAISLGGTVNTDTAARVSLGSPIEFKGRGQCVVEEILGTSRSGRQKIRLVKTASGGRD